MKNQKTMIVGLVFLLAVFLTACDKAPATDDLNSETTMPEKLRFVTEDYPPLTFKNEAGEITGLATEIVQTIMKKQNIDEEIELMPWNDAYNLALNNSNVVIFSIKRTTEREELFNWVGPIAKNSTIFYVKKGSGLVINNLEEAKKLNAIGVVEDWFSKQNLENSGFKNLNSSILPAEVVEKLIKEEIQAAPFTDITVGDIVEDAGYTINDIEPAFLIDSGYVYIGYQKALQKIL